jgi:nucleotide-binding universal stress UspA family protein
MYTNFLIPTDGSELAGKAVQHGIALGKRIGAKATALTVWRHVRDGPGRV